MNLSLKKTPRKHETCQMVKSLIQLQQISESLVSDLLLSFPSFNDGCGHFICIGKSFILKKPACDQTVSSVQLTGELDDCFCDVESIDVFNNFKVFPRIKKLTEKDYFRYYRVRTSSVPPFKPVFPPLTSVFNSEQVNLKRPCPFWPDDGHCSIKDCHVEPCPEVRGHYIHI